MIVYIHSYAPKPVFLVTSQEAPVVVDRQRRHVFAVSHINCISAAPALNLQAPRLNKRERKAAAWAAHALKLLKEPQTTLTDLVVASKLVQPDPTPEIGAADHAKTTSPTVRSTVSCSCAGVEPLILPSPPPSLRRYFMRVLMCPLSFSLSTLPVPLCVHITCWCEVYGVLCELIYPD